jgi:hypothetical protein
MHFGYAKAIKRTALLAAVYELKALLPDTEATRRNLANIEALNPPEKMHDDMLCSFVDLLYRSVPIDQQPEVPSHG